MDDETAPPPPVGHPGHPRRGRRGDPGQHRRVRRTTARAGRQLRPGDAAARLLPQHHPRHRRWSASRRASSPGARHRRQAGRRRPSTPARPPSRRSSPARSTPPTSARTRPSTPSPSPRARRVRIIAGAASGGASLVVKPGINRRAGPARARRSPRRSSATPRTSRCATGCKEQGPEDRPPRAAATSTIVPQENAQTLETFKQRRRSTAPGCPSRGPRRLVRRPAARCWSTSATCGRTGQFVTTHLIVRTEFLKAHPDVVQEAARGPGRGERRSSTANPAEAQQASSTTAIEQAHRQAAGREADRSGVARTSTFTNDPIASLAAEAGRPRRRRRAARAGRPQAASTT